MARRTHTYAIRLAVEGGGQVKAELVSVGGCGRNRCRGFSWRRWLYWLAVLTAKRRSARREPSGRALFKFGQEQ